MSLSRAQNMFMPANINSIVLAIKNVKGPPKNLDNSTKRSKQTVLSNCKNNMSVLWYTLSDIIMSIIVDDNFRYFHDLDKCP